MKKRKEAAEKEARLALDDYDSSLKQLEEKNEEQSKNLNFVSGKRAFGPSNKKVKKVQESSDQIKSNNYNGYSDSEESLEAEDNDDDGQDQSYNDSHRNVNVDPNVLRKESEIGHDALFKVTCAHFY